MNDLPRESCPIGMPGETWGDYWTRRDRERGESIVAVYGRHEVNAGEIVYVIKCGTCGETVHTDGDYFWHKASGVEPEEANHD